MKLSECTLGTLVIEHLRNRPDQKPRIGHIVGLTTNSTDEIIPVVQLAQPYRAFGHRAPPNEPFGIHHNNLDRLVD